MKPPTLKKAQRTPEVTCVSKEQARMLRERILSLGYDNVTDFAVKTGLVSRDGIEPDLIVGETINRAMREGARNISPVTLAMIMMCAEFSREEIEEWMEGIGDRFVSRFIAAALRLGDRDLSPQEIALVDAYRKIGEPEAVALQLQALAKIKGVDLTPSTSQLLRPVKSRKRL